MNPELKDPINAAGAILAVIGGCMMFAVLLFTNVLDAIPIIGFILWAIGIAILAIHTRHKGG